MVISKVIYARSQIKKIMQYKAKNNLRSIDAQGISKSDFVLLVYLYHDKSIASS